MIQLRRRWVLAVAAAFITVGTGSFGASMARACETDLVRGQAQRDFPDYQVAAVRAEQGIVTLLFRARSGTGTFAVALHAAGTRLSTSVMGVGLDSAELGRVSQPLTTWWQLTELQRALAACSQPIPEASAGDLQSTLDAAAEAALPTHHAGFGSEEVAIRVGAALFLALIGGVLAGLWQSRHRLVDHDTTMLVVLSGLALLLRVVAHAGPADIREVLTNPGTGRAGWGALLHLIFSVLPRRDETIWILNRIIGALSVPLLYVVMRRRFVDRLAALAGATALAVTPLIARFSASDVPYILLCAALLGALVVYDRWVETGSTGAMILGCGLLTAALQLRPEAPWLIVPAALVALAGGVPTDLPTRLRRPSVIICVLLFVAINVLCMSWGFGGNEQYLDAFVLIGSVFGSPWADPNTTPRMLGGLVALGALSALLYQYRWAGLLWLAAALVAFPLDYPVTLVSSIPVDGHLAVAEVPQYANARYHIPAMYLACGLAGLAVGTALALIRQLIGRTLPAAGAVAIGIVCLAAAPRLDLLRRMWTPQREFEFFRDGLARLDAGCQVVTMVHGGDAGFVPFSYLRPGLVDTDPFLTAPPPGDCFVYYRGGNCYALDLVPERDRPTFQMNPSCRAIEERFRLEPITEGQLPALPYRGEVYVRDPLPVGFYHLLEARRGS